MIDHECPVDAAGEALRLASHIKVHGIPLDFDAGDLRWKEILGLIAREFSNHATVRHQLDELLHQARLALADDCDGTAAENEGNPCVDCAQYRLAEHWLWEAALDASEKAYQRWLARDALRRAREQER